MEKQKAAEELFSRFRAALEENDNKRSKAELKLASEGGRQAVVSFLKLISTGIAGPRHVHAHFNALMCMYV